jgi:hypothetical protein
MIEYLGRDHGDSAPRSSPAPSVAVISTEGRLLAQFGEAGDTECVIRKMVAGSEDICHELPAKEFYALAIIAQSVHEVASGQCGSFSRQCICRRGNLSYPCTIEVEPYIRGKLIEGAKVTTCPLPTE